MDRRLEDAIGEVCRIPLTDSLSDDAVVALSNIYSSMLNLVAVNALDEEYGDRKIYESKLDTLYTICRKRCAVNQSLARRSRMLTALCGVVYSRVCGLPNRKSTVCRNYMYDAITEWQSMLIATARSREMRAVEYGILRCITDYFYYAEDEEHEFFDYFKRRIAEWAESLDGDGLWQDVSDFEALCRIEIMSRNSYMFSDDTYDRHIDKARAKYCGRCVEALDRNGGKISNCVSDPADSDMLCMLYGVLIGGGDSADYAKADIVADFSSRQAERFPLGSAERLPYQRVCVAALCMKIVDKTQNQAFANIA